MEDLSSLHGEKARALYNEHRLDSHEINYHELRLMDAEYELTHSFWLADTANWLNRRTREHAVIEAKTVIKGLDKVLDNVHISYDAHLWQAYEHYQQNKDAYQEQAMADAQAAGVDVSFGEHITPAPSQ